MSKRILQLSLASYLASCASPPVHRDPPRVEGGPVPVSSVAVTPPAPTAGDAPALDGGDGTLRLSWASLPVPGEPRHQADWGIAAVVRTAEIPYESDNDSVSSFVPMLFFEGDRWFLRGTSGGAHLWEEDGLELNAIGRLRFFDIPSEYQNTVQGDTVDFGLQVHKDVDRAWWEAEWLTNDMGDWHANARVGSAFSWENWILLPALNVRYGSSDFISRYYAVEPLTGQEASGDFIVSPEVTARYHLVSDLYLLGTLRYNLFAQGIRDLDAVDRPGNYEALLGFGFFQDRGEPQFLSYPRARETADREIDLPPYVRVAQGWATPSNLGEILSGDIEDDEFENRMTSVFYGHPLTDRLFGLPLDVYLSPGVAYHWSSEVQDPTYELVAKMHLYYTVNWPTPWRIGVAEGFSWIEEVTYLEGKNMESKDYRPSQLMNYLDVTVDVNLGELFGVERLRGLWLGGSVHHRSSIFESASQFGRIKGGSNYPSIYLQFDLL